MFNSRPLMTLMAMVTTTGATSESALDKLIAFDDPYRCVAGKDFSELLGGIISWEDDGQAYKVEVNRPPIPVSFREQVGSATLVVDGDEYRATVPLRGTWHELPLRSLVVVEWAESESGFYLIFDASPEAVREAANKAGFQIPLSRSEYRDDEVTGVTVGVDEYQGSGALFCINA
jgi:hypothetical protein